MSKTNEELVKEAQKRLKSTQRLKRFYTIIFITLIVCLFLMHFINKYAIEEKSIYQLIGNNMSTSISTRNALLIRENSIAPFARLLQKGNYESAYEYCTEEYKAQYPLEEFRRFFSKVDCETIDMKQVKAKSDYCYEAKIVYKEKKNYSISGDEIQTFETTYMLYPNEFNTENIKISPNGFLYAYHDEDFEKNGVKVHIDECIVNVDDIYIKGTIKNTAWFSKVVIQRLGVSYNGALRKVFNFPQELEKGQEVNFEKTIENTGFLLPNSFQVERLKNEDTLRTYNFYFKEEK